MSKCGVGRTRKSNDSTWTLLRPKYCAAAGAAADNRAASVSTSALITVRPPVAPPKSEGKREGRRVRTQYFRRTRRSNRNFALLPQRDLPVDRTIVVGREQRLRGRRHHGHLGIAPRKSPDRLNGFPKRNHGELHEGPAVSPEHVRPAVPRNRRQLRKRPLPQMRHIRISMLGPRRAVPCACNHDELQKR